jgi:oligoendopeptidase F
MNKTTLPTTWNLSLLFKSDEDPEVEAERTKVKEVSYAFINKWKDRQDYLEDTKVLREALDEYNAWIQDYGTDGTEGYYFGLRSALDENDPKLKARENQVTDFATKILNDIQFFELRLAKATSEAQAKFLAADELKPYRHFLEKLFEEAKYQLTEPEEKVINLLAPMATGNWVRMTSSFLAKEEREVLTKSGKREMKTFAEISDLISEKNKAVRDDAARAVNEVLAKHVEVAENELNSVLQSKKVSDELRGYTRPDAARHMHDDIATNVVDSLLKAVTSQFAVPARFYALKAKLLKVDKLQYHERNVEVGELNQKIEYPEAVEIVGNSLSKLDPEFAEIFQGFVYNGQIDVYPKKGKGSGAFCTHNLIKHPTYILLNYTDRIREVMTLAHEVGHGINNELIKQKQNAINFGTPTSTAEVASTFMEDFALQELLAKSDEETKFSLMMNKLNDDVSTIYRQVACYLFEQELHGKFRSVGYLPKETIGEIFQQHMASYMGDAVELSAGSENWWVYWSHIRNFFYVYSYASGLLISKALQNKVKQDHAFINKVKYFLSVGTSEAPQVIFQNLGIDITDTNFWNAGLSEVEKLLAETEELAAKLGKI